RAVLVTFLAGFFAVFLDAMEILLLTPPAPRTPCRDTEATDVARPILPRMVMVKENLAGPKLTYTLAFVRKTPQALRGGTPEQDDRLVSKHGRMWTFEFS